MFIAMSSVSRQYVKVPVSARLAGVSVDLTADSVQMAFSAVDSDPSTWYVATWETDSTTTPAVYLARILVGPGGAVTLADGVYDIWVKVTDSPEVPVLRSPTRLKIL